MLRTAVTTGLLIMAALAAQAGAQGESVKYFRHVTVDGRYDIVGMNEIPEERATGINCYRFIYDEAERPTEIVLIKGGRPSPGSYFGEKVASAKIAYGEGFERRLYYNAAGIRVPDAGEVFGRAFKLDANGYRVSMTNRDSQNRPAYDNAGVVRYDWEVDGKGRRTTEKRFDKVGIQFEDQLGRYESRWEYGETDYPTRVSYYGEEGKLSEDEFGTAVEEFAYDAAGRLIETRYLGEKRKPRCRRGIIPSYEFWDYFVTRRRNLEYAVERREYDKDGYLTAVSYFDEKGNPAEREDTGTAVERYTYDERGNLIKVSYCGKNGNPTKSKLDGACAVKNTFGPYGDAITTEYYDAKGKPTNRSEYGCAGIHTSYDEAGNIIEERYYDRDGEPSVRKDVGSVAMIQWDRDDCGHATEARYYDLDGKPKEVKRCAKTVMKHDEYGYLLEERYFDCEGAPTKKRDWFFEYAAESRAYDEARNLVETCRYGPDGKLLGETLTSIAIVRAAYDARGRLVQFSFHDEGGKLTDHYFDYAIARFEYGEEDGREVVRTFFYNCLDQILDIVDFKLIEY
ncbi:MAG: hypothetical protein PVH29_00785 [Candidatus Zixiibacteriota bacterium]|jgi:YD repeat-containing protein